MSYSVSQPSQRAVTLIEGEMIPIPSHIKQIFLSGVIPTPKTFIHNHDEATTIAYQMKHLTLNQLLDIDKLKKIYQDMLEACQTYSHPYLIIASPVVAFTSLQDKLHNQLPSVIEAFLHQMGGEIVSLIESEIEKMKKKLPVIVWIPSYTQLEIIPSVHNDQEYIAALVSGFPALKMNKEEDKDLFILHNEGFLMAKQMEIDFRQLYSYVHQIGSLEFTKTKELYDYKK